MTESQYNEPPSRTIQNRLDACIRVTKVQKERVIILIEEIEKSFKTGAGKELISVQIGNLKAGINDFNSIFKENIELTDKELRSDYENTLKRVKGELEELKKRLKNRFHKDINNEKDVIKLIEEHKLFNDIDVVSFRNKISQIDDFLPLLKENIDLKVKELENMRKVVKESEGNLEFFEVMIKNAN